jgi:ubiquinone/menaquinone biosynthesis C-methylase UbiE
LREPYLSQFVERVRDGAGTQDIHDADAHAGYAVTTPAYEALVEREVDRVSLHRDSLCPLLEATVGKVDRILDVGCGTGGTTVALALSSALGAAEVIGVDPNFSSLEAAEIRARGYDLGQDQVRFLAIESSQPLPFPANDFDLTVCVSVLEYVQKMEDRQRLVEEMKRVTRPGGYIFLSTPSPYRLWSLHTGRFLGDFRRHQAHPWSNTPAQIKTMFQDCEAVSLHRFVVPRALRRLGLPVRALPGPLARGLMWFFRWQRFLMRKPA